MQKRSLARGGVYETNSYPSRLDTWGKRAGFSAVPVFPDSVLLTRSANCFFLPRFFLPAIASSSTGSLKIGCGRGV